MFSLRTDDIPGARPRLRHFEKKIIRDNQPPPVSEYRPDFGSRQAAIINSSRSLQVRDLQQPSSRLIGSKVPLFLPQDQYPQDLVQSSVQPLNSVPFAESHVANEFHKQAKSQLILPEYVENPQELKPQNPIKQTPSEPKRQQSRSLHSEQEKPVRARPLIEGMSFNIITNHKVQYKMEPMEYVPSWS